MRLWSIYPVGRELLVNTSVRHQIITALITGKFYHANKTSYCFVSEPPIVARKQIDSGG